MLGNTAPIKLALLMATVTAAWAADNDAPRPALELCSACHSAGGSSISPNFPRLAGQQAPYIEQQLKAFRNQSRADADAQSYMWGMASKLDDATISKLAGYYAAQPRAPGKAGAPVLVAKGKDIYEGGIPVKNIPPCASCHGPDGAGVTVDGQAFPMLAGQHAAYLVKQLQVFHTELRPSAVLMRSIVKPMSPPEMEAVAVFLQSK